MSTTTTTTIKNINNGVIDNLINELSFEDLKKLIAAANEEKKSRAEYVAPIKKQHIIDKAKDMELILNEVCGKSAAYKKLVALHTEGKINIAKWTVKDIDKNQLTFMLKSFKNIFYFTTKDENTLTSATPKIIGEIILRAATMKPENFAKVLRDKK